MSAAAVLALAALVGGVPCRPDVKALTAPALFARYPARAASPRQWRLPVAGHGEARAYRTVLRRDGGGPADLAGAYKVVRIGCGAGAVCPAFVDGRRGRVIFAPALRSVSAMTVDAEPGFEMLTYRRDSRLLVVIGAPNENEARRGVRDFCAGRGARL